MQHNYVESIKEHMQQCIFELDSLSKLAEQRNLTQTEYYAAERVLQILIESAIGFAKQSVKLLGNPISPEAYQAFKVLHDHQMITDDNLNLWKKIIGLRNVLVHDYLNVNREIIDQVVKKKQYLFIFDFVKNLTIQS
ncbi:MAG: type VII toxin-antitoxin system HepT family RNase toxin [Gammaproteobacteria bacterium]